MDLVVLITGMNGLHDIKIEARPSQKNVIEIRDIRFCWPGQANDVLDISAIDVKKGEHLFIQGPSGSGKTTLLNLLTGIILPVSGSVKILGSEQTILGNIQRDRFRADHLGVIFQQFNLLPYLSLLENIMLPCWFSAKRKQRAGNMEAEAIRLLKHLCLSPELAEKPVIELSMGEQQRAAVARALIGNPEIIIADEPTSALDVESRDRFLDLLFKESDERGSTLVFVSHDPYISEKFSRRIELPKINRAKSSADRAKGGTV